MVVVNQWDQNYQIMGLLTRAGFSLARALGQSFGIVGGFFAGGLICKGGSLLGGALFRFGQSSNSALNPLRSVLGRTNHSPGTLHAAGNKPAPPVNAFNAWRRCVFNVLKFPLRVDSARSMQTCRMSPTHSRSSPPPSGLCYVDSGLISDDDGFRFRV